MMTATESSNHTSTYTYDGDGHRVKRSIAVAGQPSPVETWQVYGLGGELIAEYAANGSALTPQKEYGYRNGQLLVIATITTGWGSAPTLNDNPLQVGVTTVQARHITELRTAINALRSHMSLSAYSWQYSATTNDYVSANPILEMRTALDQALGAPTGGYSAGLAQNQLVMAIHIQELRNRVLAAWQSGSGVDIRWMVSDQLGTPRMTFDQSGSLANVSRHDYLPFGEELFAGVRSAQLGYTNGDGARQKFTQKERDNETGLDYFIHRYYPNAQGRFTSPDLPFADQSEGDPQSWNLYTYAGNTPLVYSDPFGWWKQVDCSTGRCWQAEEGDKDFSGLAKILHVTTKALEVFFQGEGNAVTPGHVFDTSGLKDFLIDSYVQNLPAHMMPIPAGGGLIDVNKTEAGIGLLSRIGRWLGFGKKAASTAEEGVTALRQAYEAEVRALADKAAYMKASGRSAEQIAIELHAERRALGVKYKDVTPPEILQKVLERNLRKYGDELGPSIEWLRKQGKSWQDIIESASRPGGGDLKP